MSEIEEFRARSGDGVLAKKQFKAENTLSMSANNQNIVIISPPGGVGEVAAVQAANMGSSVKWFVVTPPLQSTSAVSLSTEALESIQGKGTLELAGAKADTLLLPSDDPLSALKAVSTWCSNANSIICTFDGIEESVLKAAKGLGVNPKELDGSELFKTNNLVLDAIKVAAKEACSSTTSMKVAVMPATMDVSNTKGSEENEEQEGKNLLSSLFGDNKVEVPKSLSKAMTASGLKKFAILRYGELFGIPESSVSFITFILFP